MFKKIRRSYKAYRKKKRTQVYLISFPKSGRTWLRTMVGKAICEKYGFDDKFIMRTYYITELAGLQLTEFDHDGSCNKDGNHLTALVGKKNKYRNKKVIFLVRDPRDVVVSSYFEATKRKVVYEGKISDFIRHDCYGINKIIAFYNNWFNNRTIPKDFLLIQYEELHKGPHSCLKKVMDFIGMENADEDIINTAVEYSRFDNMKKLEEKKFFKTNKLRPGNPDDPESFKVRKGIIGGYKEYLNPEDIEYADNVMQELERPFYPY